MFLLKRLTHVKRTHVYVHDIVSAVAPALSEAPALCAIARAGADRIRVSMPGRADVLLRLDCELDTAQREALEHRSDHTFGRFNMSRELIDATIELDEMLRSAELCTTGDDVVYSFRVL